MNPLHSDLLSLAERLLSCRSRRRGAGLPAAAGAAPLRRPGRHGRGCGGKAPECRSGAGPMGERGRLSPGAAPGAGPPPHVGALTAPPRPGSPKSPAPVWTTRRSCSACTPRGMAPRGPLSFYILGGSEFRLRQGFAARQNAWTRLTARLAPARRASGGSLLPVQAGQDVQGAFA